MSAAGSSRDALAKARILSRATELLSRAKPLDLIGSQSMHPVLLMLFEALWEQAELDSNGATFFLIETLIGAIVDNPDTPKLNVGSEVLVQVPLHAFCERATTASLRL